VARASAGQQGSSPEKLLDDLCGGLEPLLLDRLERHRVPDAALVEGSGQLIFDTADEQRKALAITSSYTKEMNGIQAFKERLGKILWDAVDFIYSPRGMLETNDGRKRQRIASLVKDPERPPAMEFSAAQAARLNTMLHLSILADDEPMRPGNVYLIGDADTTIAKSLAALGFDATRLRKDTFGSTSKGGQIVLIEATPACDYAQGKWTMPRFVAGFLASEKDASGLRAQAEFLRSYGPLWLKSADGAEAICHLIVNSHFAPSIGMDEVEAWSPILMLRRRTLTDLQVWLSSQHMRQGLLNVN
jgi:hypothetical protein